MKPSATKLGAVEQLQLLPDRIQSRPVDYARIPLLQNTTEALEYACTLANVVPKAIYLPMEIDKGTWSRICSGEFDLDGRDIRRFESVVGNHAYLLYLNYEAGFDLTTLRRRMDDQERRTSELEQENADLRRTLRLMAEAMRGKG